MNKRYLNLFWVLIATVIITNEFFIGQFQLANLKSKEPIAWLLISVWLLIAINNIYDFFSTSTSKIKS